MKNSARKPVAPRGLCADCPSRDPYIVAIAAAVMEGCREGPLLEGEVAKMHRLMEAAVRALRDARRVPRPGRGGRGK